MFISIYLLYNQIYDEWFCKNTWSKVEVAKIYRSERYYCFLYSNIFWIVPSRFISIFFADFLWERSGPNGSQYVYFNRSDDNVFIRTVAGFLDNNDNFISSTGW